MSAAIVALTILGGALELDDRSSFGFDRVDILSEDPGTWLHYDLPYAAVFPASPAIRFATQVKAVWHTPIRGLYLGTSIRSISAVLEAPVLLTKDHGLYWTAGLQSKLLCPAGLTAGVAWRWGRLRVGGGNLRSFDCELVQLHLDPVVTAADHRDWCGPSLRDAMSAHGAWAHRAPPGPLALGSGLLTRRTVRFLYVPPASTTIPTRWQTS